MTAGICPYCGSPLPLCHQPGPDGVYRERPAEPCNETVEFHATPEHRWEWFGEDKPCGSHSLSR